MAARCWLHALNCPLRQLRTVHVISYRHISYSTVAKSKINKWLQAYEDFIGLTLIKEAQNNVLQVFPNFSDRHRVCDSV